jgi:hypothetical protein
MLQSLQNKFNVFLSPTSQPPPRHGPPPRKRVLGRRAIMLYGKSITTKNAAGSGCSPVPAVIADILSLTE